VRFWDDASCSSQPLNLIFGEVYDCCDQQRISVKGAANLHWNFSFRRWLNENQLAQIRDLPLTCPLGEGLDRAIWKLTEKRVFTVKSMYSKLAEVWINRSFKYL
jgi:hypothetical protein